MIYLAQVNIRVGGDPNYLNVDFDHAEIGSLRLSAHGGVTVWAHDFDDKPKLEAIGRFVEPVVMATIRSFCPTGLHGV